MKVHLSRMLMKYFSGYYRQQGDACISLVLKQLVYHKDKLPVLFGCMQSSGEGEGVEALTDWFYREGLHLCRGKNEEAEKLEHSLHEIMIALQQEEYPWKSARENTRDKAKNNADLTAMLCVGNNFLLWNQGKHKIHLLNTRFGRPYVRCITEEKEAGMIGGKLQEGVGILVTTEGFHENISKQQLQECLWVKELSSEERVQKRINELGRKAEEVGKNIGEEGRTAEETAGESRRPRTQHVGAMLVVTS